MEPSVPLKTPLPLFRLLLLLSATTGMVDAASILGMGKVFTANMTGNVVFLGFAAAGAPGFTPLPYLVALAAFMTGAVVSGGIWRRPGPRPLRHCLTVAALFEGGLLLAAALVALLPPARGASTVAWNVLGLVAPTACAMGVRNAVVRQLKVPDFTTTVLTLTITGIASDSRLALGTSAGLPARLGAVAMIFAGALAGAVLVLHAGLAATLAASAAIEFGGTILCARHPLMASLQRP